MKELQKLEKKLKGYGYDSLCLRYQIARDAQARAEAKIKDHMYCGQLDRAMAAARRDEVRFYQILDDLIGEHD